MTEKSEKSVDYISAYREYVSALLGILKEDDKHILTVEIEDERLMEDILLFLAERVPAYGLDYNPTDVRYSRYPFHGTNVVGAKNVRVKLEVPKQ